MSVGGVAGGPLLKRDDLADTLRLSLNVDVHENRHEIWSFCRRYGMLHRTCSCTRGVSVEHVCFVGRVEGYSLFIYPPQA